MPKEHCRLYGNRISVHEHSRRYEQQSVDPIRQTNLTTTSRSRVRSKAKRRFAKEGFLPKVIKGSTTRRNSFAFRQSCHDGFVSQQGIRHIAQHRSTVAASTGLICGCHYDDACHYPLIFKLTAFLSLQAAKLLIWNLMSDL